MKTKEQLQTAVDEIRTVCAKHEIILFGGCTAVYGEVVISENTEKACGWDNVARVLSNTVEDDGAGGYCVNGIGELACK